MEKRRIAQRRAMELKTTIQDYQKAQKTIPTGFQQWDRILKQQERIKEYFGATDEEWQNWHWQLQNRISTTAVLKELIDLTDREIAEIDQVGSRYRWAVSPYYLSLIDPNDPLCPVRRQAIPAVQEYTDPWGEPDPMAEEYTSPVPAITRRYPDRLIIKVTNRCAMYCRHCQRRRNIGEQDFATPRAQLEEALDYIRQNQEIRDVLLTGGDGFMLNDKTIAWLLEELSAIPHVEIKRFGTRTPVTLPYRITDELCAISQHLPVYVNTRNHPWRLPRRRVTPARGGRRPETRLFS